MYKIDLHTHTTCSDGTLTPAELIKKANEVGLEKIALTDHDTTEGIDEAIEAAKGLQNIEVVDGVELSSRYKDKDIHIVGLFIDKDEPRFSSTLNELREKRLSRNKRMINKLRGLGLDVTYDELIALSGGKVVTRAHFAALLMKTGYVKDKNEAFAKYIGAGGPGYVKREILSAEKSIELILGAGGLPIIAHPFSYGLNENAVEEMAACFKAWGAVGMECYYPTHSYADTAYALTLCRTYDLLPSGGSDFHGDNKPGLELGSGYDGNLDVPYKIFNDLKEKKYGK